MSARIPELCAPGEIIADKYRVERMLGMGGMSAVFSAVHIALDQRIAIKIMLPKHVADARFAERFLREAKAAARIRGDHIARVLDVGTTKSGAPFMALELLEGEDLGAHLAARGPLPVNEAVDLVLQACDGIARAHAVGVIHRDIKPANLFLTSKDGMPCVKVIDFGISKLTHEDKSLTQTSEIFGSPQYMSPEQIKASRDVDARSDVWALACVLYELVTGQPPFQAQSVMMLGSVILNDPPRPPATLRADVPPELEAVILRALEKEPANRPGSVVELAVLLSPFGGGMHGLIESLRRLETAQAAPPSSRRHEPADIEATTIDDPRGSDAAPERPRRLLVETGVAPRLSASVVLLSAAATFTVVVGTGFIISLVTGCPPAGDKSSAASSSSASGRSSPAVCSKVGQSCEYSPGKLGTCVQKDECAQGSACFVCQSQH